MGNVGVHPDSVIPAKAGIQGAPRETRIPKASCARGATASERSESAVRWWKHDILPKQDVHRPLALPGSPDSRGERGGVNRSERPPGA